MKPTKYKQRITVDVFYTDAETEEPADWDWNQNQSTQTKGPTWIELVEWEEPEQILFPSIFGDPQ